MIKFVFITIIALVIPVFFTLMFTMSAYNRLAQLRARCRETQGRLESGEPNAAEAFQQALAGYESARRTFPGSLLARLGGFDKDEFARRSMT